MFELKKDNGFILMDGLLGLLIVALCATLLFQVIFVLKKDTGMYIDETIQKEWFYSD